MSAPEYPTVRKTSFSKSTSSESCFPALWTPKICTRCFASGKPIYTRLSIRPRRTNSRSSSSGLLVAQIKMTACLSENLSTPVSSFLQTSWDINASKVSLLRGSFLACLPAIASISSTNTKEGDYTEDKENISLIRATPLFSLSVNSAPEAKTNGIPLCFASVRAKSVLPVPGGPERRTPYHAK
nr:Uncharacterised protein [Ipomoea batatas]